MMEMVPIQHAEATNMISSFAVTGRDRDSMEFCILSSIEMGAFVADDEVVCLWGIVLPTLLSKQVYLWSFTTPLLDVNQFLFVRFSQRVIEKLLKDYDSIVGHTNIGSEKSIRWLKWLGATFGPPHGTLLPFRITKHGDSWSNTRRYKHRV